jgi:hypothetical protein
LPPSRPRTLTVGALDGWFPVTVRVAFQISFAVVPSHPNENVRKFVFRRTPSLSLAEPLEVSIDLSSAIIRVRICATRKCLSIPYLVLVLGSQRCGTSGLPFAPPSLLKLFTLLEALGAASCIIASARCL